MFSRRRCCILERSLPTRERVARQQWRLTASKIGKRTEQIAQNKKKHCFILFCHEFEYVFFIYSETRLIAMHSCIADEIASSKVIKLICFLWFYGKLIYISLGVCLSLSISLSASTSARGEATSTVRNEFGRELHALALHLTDRMRWIETFKIHWEK